MKRLLSYCKRKQVGVSVEKLAQLGCCLTHIQRSKIVCARPYSIHVYMEVATGTPC